MISFEIISSSSVLLNQRPVFECFQGQKIWLCRMLTYWLLNYRSRPLTDNRWSKHRGGLRLIYSTLIFFNNRFFFLVFLMIYFSLSKTPFQNFQRIFFCMPLAGNIIRSCKDPNQQNKPNCPSYPVHAPIIIIWIIPHRFVFY